MADKEAHNRKAALLSQPIAHCEITQFDAEPILQQMGGMSFSARAAARARAILHAMIADEACIVILTLAGSSSAGGCMHVWRDLVRHNMVDAIVATGAAIIDMDFFEALGFRHYRGAPDGTKDSELRALRIDRLYDTYIDEDNLRDCDWQIKAIADGMAPGPRSSRAFLRELGRWLRRHAKKPHSLLAAADACEVPIFCPAFSDCSAGFGLVAHQAARPRAHVAIDSVADFRELTQIKIAHPTTGLFMIGGGVPKNFAQDMVVCAEILGHQAEMHKYAVQITVADSRDGACSSSTLREAGSWGKVAEEHEQMVFAEASMIAPLLASSLYHHAPWRKRRPRRLQRLFA